MNRRLLQPGLVLLMFGLLVGQGWQQWQRSQAAQPNDERNQSPEDFQHTAMPNSEYWQVTGVSDGDSLVVQQGRRSQRIRLCGIDAPEKDQPLGNAAKTFLEQLVAGKEVMVTPVEQDRYGRLVAEVLLPGSSVEVSVQEELLKAGMAYVYPQFVGRCWNGEVFERAEAIAQEQAVGVWGDRGNIPPWEWRAQRRAE